MAWGSPSWRRTEMGEGDWWSGLLTSTVTHFSFGLSKQKRRTFPSSHRVLRLTQDSTLSMSKGRGGETGVVDDRPHCSRRLRPHPCYPLPNLFAPWGRGVLSIILLAGMSAPLRNPSPYTILLAPYSTRSPTCRPPPQTSSRPSCRWRLRWERRWE
jgi:hypothetical protein